MGVLRKGRFQWRAELTAGVPGGARSGNSTYAGTLAEMRRRMPAFLLDLRYLQQDPGVYAVTQRDGRSRRDVATLLRTATGVEERWEWRWRERPDWHDLSAGSMRGAADLGEAALLDATCVGTPAS